ncbi:unnamed protein product, partial [marine sediment metagenome]
FSNNGQSLTYRKKTILLHKKDELKMTRGGYGKLYDIKQIYN